MILYFIVHSLYFILKLLFFLEHFQHPVSDHKAAHYIERTKHHGQKTQNQGQIIIGAGMTHDDDRSNDDHAVDGVGPRHKWRMQNGWYVGNHLDAQQNGQNDDVDKLLIVKKKLKHSDDRRGDSYGRPGYELVNTKYSIQIKLGYRCALFAFCNFAFFY